MIGVEYMIDSIFVLERKVSALGQFSIFLVLTCY
jgi:hypothetical protein